MVGPVARTHQERMELCKEIAGRLQEVYGDKLLAIGVYGSVARGTDGPYSDVEMFAVLRESEGEDCVDFSYEWSTGSWKAEVNIRSEKVILTDAGTVEGRWPLTHGPYVTALSLYDPEEFLPRLRKVAESPSEGDFWQAIREVLVGEMMEYIGKVRNVKAMGPASYLPYLAMEMAHYGAMLVGLHNRTRYTTGALVLPEAVLLPQQPEGFRELAELVMSGELREPERIATLCESFWQGLQEWAEHYGYEIHSSDRIPF